MSSEIQKVGFLRLPQVLEIIPVCRATWWSGCKEGRYPKPVKIGKRCTAWKMKDILDLAERLASQEEKQP